MVAWDWGLETGLTAEEHEGTFKMMEVFCTMNVLVVHDVNVGQNSSNCALNMDELQTNDASVVSNSLQPHGYTVHEILQARILEWVDFPFSRGSSQPRDQNQVSCTAGRFFIN